MSIIEQIKAEIKRLKEYTVKCGYPGQDEYADGNKEGRNFICDKLLSFLSTIEEKSEKSIIPNDLARARHEDDQLSEKIAAAYQLGLADKEKQIMSEVVEGEYDKYPAAIYLSVPLPRKNNGDKVHIAIVNEE